ncbi:MAG: hypothetical protein JO359_04290 [Candidatus Eremiobacteraeota bacterium]|nr:hypothetical protein [Candidatus Eremiobacteraeota bacterium]
MENWTDFPILSFLVFFLVLWLASLLGAYLHRRMAVDEEEREDLGVVVGATLTLLGLIIGFSFSMAVSRYDERKNREANEANAIGTEWYRLGLLPATEAAQARTLLKRYLAGRIEYYVVRNPQRLAENASTSTKLQDQLWGTVQRVAAARPTPITGLTVSGLNDVIDSQGFVEAAYRNRIPVAAWGMLLAISIFSSVLVPYNTKRRNPRAVELWVLPLIMAIALFLIADLDSPRAGVIKVAPANLTDLATAFQRTMP